MKISSANKKTMFSGFFLSVIAFIALIGSIVSISIHLKRKKSHRQDH